MSLLPDDDRFPNDEPLAGPSARHSTSPRGQVLRGIAAAAACDTLFTVPLVIVLPGLRPENIASALANLLLGLNMLVGYVGGRVAARYGLAHDDTRAQWLMASAVSVLSFFVELATERVIATVRLERVVAVPHHAPASISAATIVVSFAVALLLIRFGYAMGTYSQAKRDGRVHEEDEASIE